MLADIAAGARSARPLAPVLTDSALAALDAGRRALAAAAGTGAVYGLTTGVGALRDVRMPDAGGRVSGLWRSHAASFGPELSDVDARATMLVRLHQLAAGRSAVSPALAAGLERALLGGFVPVLHGYGSIGTADLTVLSQLGLALAGSGAWRGPAPAPVAVEPSDALPFISSQAMTVGIGTLAHTDLTALLHATEQVAALTFLALRGSPEAYDARVFARRPAEAGAAGAVRAAADAVRPAGTVAGGASAAGGGAGAMGGAAAVAARMRGLLGGARAGVRVQDPFALRTVPQVHGVAETALAAAGTALTAEITAAAENPLPVDGTALHHGQFLTQQLAAAFDAVRESLVGVATLSQARLAALVDPRLTDLPAFLAHGPAGSSGVMILEYVAADLAARLRATALPTTLTRTTVSIGMEEVASHSTQGILAARTAAALLPDLLATELVAATRALRLAPDRLSPSAPAATLARTALATLGDAPLDDHDLGPELSAAASLIASWVP